MKINDILRASGVNRWHIVRTVKEQSLAEHTFDVTMIARAIAKIAGYDDAEITKASLLHDLDEVIVGDFPTPTKVRARANGWELNDLYRKVTGRVLGEDEALIIHLADKMADIHWLHDHKLGSHADEVYHIMCTNFNVTMCSQDVPDNIREAASDVMVQLQDGEYTI